VGGLVGRRHGAVPRRDAPQAARREPRGRPARGLAQRVPVAARLRAGDAARQRVARRWPAAVGAGGMRRTARLNAVLLGLALAPAAGAQSLAEADTLYRQGRYDEAARELTELTLDAPLDPELYDRLGAA